MSDKISSSCIVSGELYTPGAKQTVDVSLNWEEGTVSFFDGSQNEYVISGKNYDFVCVKRGWIFTDYSCRNRSKPLVYRLVFFNWEAGKVRELLEHQSRSNEPHSVASHKGGIEIRNAEKQPVRIIHIDDEDWLLEMVSQTIRANEIFKSATVQTFRNRADAWSELLLKDPDLLITDLRNDNVPGRTYNFGMSGFQMLSLLAKKNVKYPILVLSGSLSIEGCENEARKCAGDKLRVSFLKKPATSEQLYAEISKHLCFNNSYPHGQAKKWDCHESEKSQSGLTNEQQAYIDEVFARAGKPSETLQRQIDEIRATKTEVDLTTLFLKGANTVRPKLEAELLSAVMLAKLAELKAKG